MNIIDERNAVGDATLSLRYQMAYIMEKLAAHDNKMTNASTIHSYGGIERNICHEDAKSQLRSAISVLSDVVNRGPAIIKCLKQYEGAR